MSMELHGVVFHSNSGFVPGVTAVSKDVFAHIVVLGVNLVNLVLFPEGWTPRVRRRKCLRLF